MTFSPRPVQPPKTHDPVTDLHPMTLDHRLFGAADGKLRVVGRQSLVMSRVDGHRSKAGRRFNVVGGWPGHGRGFPVLGRVVRNHARILR